MKWKNLTYLFAAVIVLSGCATTGPWTAWKKQEEQTLAAGSTVVQTAAGPVEYTVSGTEGPYILALHGSMGGYDSDEVFGKILGMRNIRIICISRPGYLRTPLETGRTAAEQADAFAALLDELGVEQAAVAGTSAGGLPAIQFALRHPDRCWGVILFSSLFRNEGIDKFTPAQMNYLHNSFQDKRSYRNVMMLEKHPERVLRVMFPDSVKQIRKDPVRMALAAEFIRTSFPLSLREAGTVNDLQQKYPFDGPQLHRITQPVLILHGGKDQWAPVEDAEKAADLIPGAKLVVFPEGDHLFPVVYLDRFKNLLMDFIRTFQPGG